MSSSSKITKQTPKKMGRPLKPATMYVYFQLYYFYYYTNIYIRAKREQALLATREAEKKSIVDLNTINSLVKEISAQKAYTASLQAANQSLRVLIATLRARKHEQEIEVVRSHV